MLSLTPISSSHRSMTATSAMANMMNVQQLQQQQQMTGIELDWIDILSNEIAEHRLRRKLNFISSYFYNLFILFYLLLFILLFL
jgi:hypothetical protein